MLNWLQKPHSDQVAKYIECYWLIEKTEAANEYNFPKLNPDPAVHLVVSPPQQPYYYEMGNEVFSGKGAHWLFAHTKTMMLDHSQPFIHLGIKFHIGALYSLKASLFDEPNIDKVLDINLAQLFNRELKAGTSLEHQWVKLVTQDPEKGVKLLDDYFLRWVTKAKEDQHSKLTRSALSLLDEHTISELGERLYCSQRTVERSFRRVTGLTLKQCQTMNKLEAMLNYLYQRHNEHIDWVEMAYLFGFSDQPHLIRHIKKSMGLTPQHYAMERGFTIDVYGTAESHQS